MRARAGAWLGSWWLRLLGAVGLMMIPILSLIPASMQSRTALPGSVEHFLGYAAVATVLVFGSRRAAFPWVVIVVLTVLAAATELLQFLSPGRNPEIVGVVGSSLGAAVGALVAYVARTRLTATASGSSPEG